MKYIFEINIITDGDMCFPFIPNGMRNDGNNEYHFERVYGNRDEAIKNTINICNFLKEHVCVGKDYVKEDWCELVDRFIKRLQNSKESINEKVDEYRYGNYEGTELIFSAKPSTFRCNFDVTDEEYEMITHNGSDVTNIMIKDAVLSLFKK